MVLERSAQVASIPVVEVFAGGHFFLENLTKGDGLTQFGVALGSIAALPALFFAGIEYLREKPRNYLYALLSLWVMSLIAFSALGILAVK